VVRDKPHGSTDEEGKSVDRQRKKQPAEVGESDKAQNNADDDHGGGFP